MTGVATSRFRTATHAVPVVRGSSVRPLFVTAAGIPSADAADLVRRMAGRYRLPDALRRAKSETIAVREAPERFSWGGIFCDREAARFRRVIDAARSLLAEAGSYRAFTVDAVACPLWRLPQQSP